MVATHRVVGQPVGRADGPEKVTGGAAYALDVVLPGTLWCKVLRSPYAHARIVKVDASKARQLPGVHAVLTGEDVRGHYIGKRLRDEPLLAWDRVRFVGDKVAAVAADDEDVAEQALSLIEVEYEPLPAVTDPRKALEADAPVLHPDLNSYPGLAKPYDTVTNEYGRDHFEKGDVEAGFAQADLIVERTYATPRTHHAYLEPHACIVWIDEDGQVQVWNASKSPMANRPQIAAFLGLPPERVTVNFAYVGGDFGGKGDANSVPLCYHLAQRTGRPVKMVFDYAEELMAANPRHEAHMTVKTGVKWDGAITAWQATTWFANGAYASYKVAPGLLGIAEIVGPYRIDNVWLDSFMVYTNTVPCGYHRAPGEVQGIFAGESHMDVIARELGMDPVDLRLKNLVQEGEEFANGHRYQEMRVEEVLREAARAGGMHEPRPANVGRGVALGHRSQGAGETYAKVVVHGDGEVEVRTSVFEPGTGTYTILRQMVAEEMGVPIERVHVAPTAMDVLAPGDLGAVGARISNVASRGAHQASENAKQELRRLAAEFLGWDEEQVSYRDGSLVNERTGKSAPMEDIASRAGGEVSGEARIAEPQGNSYTSFVAQVAEVEVDPETGQPKLRKLTSVHDTGQVLNPIGFRGQVEGGVVTGLGFALMEELVVDPDDGRVTNPSFADFKIPTERDIPALDVVLLEQPTVGVGPYNVKGIGEHANITTAPAIANAIEDAAGVRITSLPLTAGKVWRAMRRKGV
jgi:carbon-monoxide dehydrogenase large subunit